jgi:predicted RNase H-like nuclease (RuvC/YqgF family)
MDQEQAKAHMNKLLDEAGKRAADRNVEQLNFTSQALHRTRQIPGTRPDGGMSPHDMNPVQLVSNALTDARRIVDNFEKDTKELESKILRMEDEVIRLESERAQLHAQLDAERSARISLEKQIAQIVDLVSPQ